MDVEGIVELRFLAGEVGFYTGDGWIDGKSHEPTGQDIESVNKALKADRSLNMKGGLARRISTPLLESVLGLAPVRLAERNFRWYLEWVTVVNRDAILKDGFLQALKDEIKGQSSDGWGEGFEQQELENGVHCSPYDSVSEDYKFSVTLEDD